jgi:hypothetical protein
LLQGDKPFQQITVKNRFTQTGVGRRHRFLDKEFPALQKEACNAR